MKKLLLFVFTLCSLGVFAYPEGNDSLFLVGNSFYENKKYKEAIEAYQKIVNKGVHSDVLYYNLANSFYKSKDYGYAILYYEKSLKLNPNNKEAKTNLLLTKTKNEDKIEIASDILFIKLWKKLINCFTPNQWATTALVLFWIAFVSFLFVLYSKNIRTKKISVFLGLVFVLLSFMIALISFVRSSPIRNTNTAIITSTSTSLFSSPDKGSKSTVKLHSGTKIFIEDQIGNWYKIKLEDKRGGWLEKSSFELI